MIKPEKVLKSVNKTTIAVFESSFLRKGVLPFGFLHTAAASPFKLGVGGSDRFCVFDVELVLEVKRHREKIAEPFCSF